MEKKTRKQLHFIHAVTENREFCKAVNAFFDGKKKFNEEMVKSFFVDEAYKYAELMMQYKYQNIQMYDKYIAILEENRQLRKDLKNLKGGFL